MRRLNLLGIETRSGFRTLKLLQGDISEATEDVDVLVISSFLGDYTAVPGSVIGALAERLSISTARLARSPAFDFRDPLGVWVSSDLRDAPFFRLVCAELTGAPVANGEVLENVLVVLTTLETKGIPARTTMLPVLGTGMQGLDASSVIGHLLAAGEKFLQRSLTAERLIFFCQGRSRSDESRQLCKRLVVVLVGLANND